MSGQELEDLPVMEDFPPPELRAEPDEVAWSKSARARRDYECDACSHLIEMGTQYRSETWRWTFGSHEFLRPHHFHGEESDPPCADCPQCQLESFEADVGWSGRCITCGGQWWLRSEDAATRPVFVAVKCCGSDVRLMRRTEGRGS